MEGEGEGGYDTIGCNVEGCSSSRE